MPNRQYLLPVSSSSGSGGGLALSGSPATLSPSVTTLNAFGDSITFGNGVTSITQGYSYVVAKALGLTYGTDHGVAGAQMADIITQAHAVTPTAAIGSITILGANDPTTLISQGGSIYTNAEYQAAEMAYLVWESCPTDQKILAANATRVGSGWTSFAATPTVWYSTTAGDTMTATVKGTAVYVSAYVFQSLNTGFTVTIDGTLVATVTAFQLTGIAGYQCYRYAGLSNTSHTVVITAIGSGSTYAAIQFIGGNGGTLLPACLLSNAIPYQGQGPGIAAVNALLSPTVALLQSDGLSIYFANGNAALSTTANPSEYDSGNIHPNSLGNELIATAFLQVVWAGNAAASLTAQSVASLIASSQLQNQPIPNFVAAPATATAFGVAGQIAYDSTHFYVCINSGPAGGASWIRASFAAW